ncbi:MAG TPA: hypothetical protein VMW62_04495 [Chloroflexota bacterium]|nr:hypothetical protein [Chloroflexota bacterium]
MATHNFDGSSTSYGVSDGYEQPLHAGPEQTLIQAPGPDSMLNNPGSDSGDERPPAAVPMHAYGWERDSDPLFDLEPKQKG